MVCQIVGVLRQATLGPVGRGGADHQMHMAQAAHDEVGVGDTAHTQREVHTFIDHVHHAVAEVETDGDIRVLLHEVRQQGGQFDIAQTIGSRQPQLAAGQARAAPQFVLGPLDHVDEWCAAQQQQAACVRQADGACGAVEQACAQAGLQLGDVFADVGL